jgi:5-methyltetrahydropteroyltriglutamate--homocysteine methyltransferase
MKPFLTHEIGSLAKPNWRIKAIRNEKLDEEDIKEAIKWAEFLNLKEESEKLISILNKRINFTKEEKKEIIDFSSLFATKLLEKAGLDLVYDGEQRRSEMYEYPVKNIEGFEFKGYVKSFDNKFFKKAACINLPKLKNFYHVEEFKTISSFTSKPVKIPITGAYTIMDFSFDEYYIKNIYEENFYKRKKLAREKFLYDLAEKIIYPNLKKLKEEGAKFLQIDEPAATSKPDEAEIFINSLLKSIKEIHKDVFFIIHICFSDYKLLFPFLEKIQGTIKEIHFEYANRDTKGIGRSKEKRIGYKILDELKNFDFIIGLGVVDVHTDFVEPKELIRDRILYAYEKIKDPYKIFIAPDCGLRTRKWEIAYEKLKNMVEAKEIALKEIGF